MTQNGYGRDGNSFLFQKSLYYTFFYGIISFVLVLVALLLFYVTCSKKYRLNWFEKNLLERADFELARSKNEVVCVVTENELESNRSVSNLSADKKFWVPLHFTRSSSRVNESSYGENTAACFENENWTASATVEDTIDNEAKPIVSTDKQVVLSTVKFARPRVSSMNAKLDHTKIDSSFYQEASRNPSIDITRSSINISISYDQVAGILSVRLIQAKDLIPRDFSGTSDPYAKIRLLPDHKNVWQTRIHKKTLNPVFDEDFVFEVPSFNLHHRSLEIILYDFDAYSRHLSLGEVRLPLFDLSEKITLWKTLEPCSEPHKKILDLESATEEEIFQVVLPTESHKSTLCNITLHTVLMYYCTKVEIIKKVELGDLLVTLSFLQSAERLTVVINKARNLRVVDDCRLSSDSFVKVSFIQDGKRVKKKKTSVQRNDVNPVFNESVTFDVLKENLPRVSVEFSVYHDNKFGPDEFLGQAMVGLNSSSQPEVEVFKKLLGSKTAVSKWLILKDSDLK